MTRKIGNVYIFQFYVVHLNGPQMSAIFILYVYGLDFYCNRTCIMSAHLVFLNLHFMNYHSDLRKKIPKSYEIITHMFGNVYIFQINVVHLNGPQTSAILNNL